MLTRIKQWLCEHRYDLADLKPRDKDGIVSCACRKCGQVHRAEYGLALPGVFDRNSPERSAGASVADFTAARTQSDERVDGTEAMK